MARKTNTAGSSNGLREDVLSALGVLKVATTDQIQRLMTPHLSYRHTDKPTEAARKTARTAAHAGAFADLRSDGLAENGGKTPGAESLRHLTEKGLKAASYALDRPMWEMGGTGRGAGSSGATHAMSVNETVLALLRPKPDLALLDGEPEEALQTAREVVAAPAGLGTLADYMTEVGLPATGTWTNPGKGGAQADIVVTAAEDNIPLLFVEVDNCHESAQKLAAKIDQYVAFLRRPAAKTLSPHTAVQPMWRTRWAVPDPEYGENPLPPLLFVFNRLGARNPDTVTAALEKLTWRHWAGHERHQHFSYDQKLPIVTVDFDQLREHGPHGAIFRRFGRTGHQTLHHAVGNPHRDAYLARRRKEEAARDAEQRAQQRRKAERDARRPRCTDCQSAFTDDRWETVENTPADPHPTLCTACAWRARDAEQTARRQAEQERLRQEAAAEEEAQGRRFFRRRSSSERQ